MKLATLDNGTPDGELVVVSADAAFAASAAEIAPNLLSALQNWKGVSPQLRELAYALDAGSVSEAFAFVSSRCRAPLPRTFQWCDGSAFLNHGHLMEQAFKSPPIPNFETIPVMYQGASDDFLGPHDDVPFPSEEHGIDFEGEFGVILDETPMGVSACAALEYVRFVVQLNDWSLRALGAQEMQTGFGFLQAKPSTSFAPLAVTPDELGAAWVGGRVDMELHVAWNGARFGEPRGIEMNFPFGELIAHAAKTRNLSAGTVIGSGTVSNVSRAAGSACIAERRVIEMIDDGKASTSFMKYGDSVRMEARYTNGQSGPFGVIEQRVIAQASV